jgi:hypothetical protein
MNTGSRDLQLGSQFGALKALNILFERVFDANAADNLSMV